MSMTDWQITFHDENALQTRALLVAEGHEYDLGLFPRHKRSAVADVTRFFPRLIRRHRANRRTNWDLVARDFQDLIDRADEILPLPRPAVERPPVDGGTIFVQRPQPSDRPFMRIVPQDE